MHTLVTLLSPRLIGARNTVARTERRGLYLALGGVGVLFWLGLFGTMYFLIGRIWDIMPDFAPFLARKLLELVLASLFPMLTFSTVITALSTYFLADDLELLLALPVSRTKFHLARFVDTLAQSSWMMAIFGLPMFLAYGLRMHAGGAYYAALVLAVPALLVISANIGVISATLLVNVFPARRTKELMVLLGIVMVATLFLLLRTLRPERLVNAQEFENLAAYLAEMQLPAPVLYPPRWVSVVLASTVVYAPFPWMEAGLLFTGTLASSAAARWAVAVGFAGGWSRAQEARSARFYRSPGFDWLVRPFPAAWRAIAGKDLRVFARDPSQWSQIFLLAGICGIYLVSVQSLPMTAFQGVVLQSMKRAISFLNLGMGGFVMAAIAARFQFTAVSREGRAWWIVRSAPIRPADMLRAKSVLGLAPMWVVGLVVVLGSGWLLDAPPSLLLLEGITTLFLAYGISGLAIAMGALWPDFRADTAARAASGPAAVLFMVVALVLVFCVLALEALGGWLFLRESGSAAWASVPLFVAAALCVGVGRWPVSRSAELLWSRGL